MARKSVCIRKLLFQVFINFFLVIPVTTQTPVFKTTLTIFTFDSPSFIFLITMSAFTFNFMDIFSKICHKSCTISKMGFVRYDFCNVFSLSTNSFKFFCWFFYDEIILVWSIVKYYRNFFTNYIPNYICYVQHLYIYLYNDNDLQNIYLQNPLYKYSRFLNFHIPVVC